MSRGRDALVWLAPVAAEDTELFDSIARFRIGEVEFRCSCDEQASVRSVSGRFYIRKDRRLVEEYVSVLDGFQGGNIVELGIAEGGSVALTTLVAAPRKLVGLELDENRVRALDGLIEARELTDRIRPYYGVDQADRARLRAIIDDEFTGGQLDLVVDDASHLLAQTRASFETLFPRLRPGGLFLIEDWNYQHLWNRWLAAALADPESPVHAEVERKLAEGAVEPPLTRLIIELLLAQAESDQHLSSVAAGPHWVAIRRAGGPLDPATFRVSDLYTDDMGLLCERAGA
jgi:SAM-dependent methyltransferase